MSDAQDKNTARHVHDALIALTGLEHAIFAIVLSKAGGSVTLDHEDGHALKGKAVASKVENGTIHLWLVDVP